MGGSRKHTASHAADKQQKPDPAVGAATDSPTIAELDAKRSKIATEVQSIEKQIWDVETRYVSAANQLGTAVTGYEGFLTGAATPKQNMRCFSESSATGNNPMPPIPRKTL